MPTRPTRKAALEAKRKLKENAPGDSEQAVVVAPKPGRGARKEPSAPEEPEQRKNPPARRTRQTAAQARRPAAAAAAPAAEPEAAEEWVDPPAAALEEPEPAEEAGMRGGAAKEDGEDKAGPSGKKDAAEEEASTAPLPEKVHAVPRLSHPCALCIAGPACMTGRQVCQALIVRWHNLVGAGWLGPLRSQRPAGAAGIAVKCHVLPCIIYERAMLRHVLWLGVRSAK